MTLFAGINFNANAESRTKKRPCFELYVGKNSQQQQNHGYLQGEAVEERRHNKCCQYGNEFSVGQARLVHICNITSKFKSN